MKQTPEIRSASRRLRVIFSKYVGLKTPDREALSIETVRAIKLMLSSGFTIPEILLETGASDSQVRDIKRGKSYTDIDAEL